MSNLSNRDPISLLLYEAKRKPKVKDLVDRIHELTDADIDNAEVPMLWYKRALKLYRRAYHARALGGMDVGDDSPINSVSLYEPFFKHGFTPDPEGEIREWTGGEQWMQIKRGNHILLGAGALLWFPDTGGLWIDSIFLEHYGHEFILRSRFQGRATKSGYTQAKRQRILSQHPELGKDEAPKDPGDRGLFRVYKL